MGNIAAGRILLLALCSVEAASALRHKIDLLGKKTDIEARVDFLEAPDSHVYLIKLVDVPEDVSPDQIVASFIGPNDRGDLDYLNVRIGYKKGFIVHSWKAADFTVLLRQPVKSYTVPEISRDRIYVRDPASQSMLRKYGGDVHEHEAKLLFKDGKGSWRITVTVPRSMLGGPRVVEDWTDESISYDYPDEIGESVKAFTGKHENLGLPYTVTRDLKVLKPPKEFQPTRLQKMGFK